MASVTIRPLAAHDEATIVKIFDGLTPEQRWQRFHTGMARLPPAMRHQLADVDQRTRVALVLELDGEPIGIGRYTVVAPGRAEVAVAVVSQHTGRGLGSRLIDALAEHAANNDIGEAVFDVLAGNEPALTLARSRGAELTRRGSTIVGHVQPASGRRSSVAAFHGARHDISPSAAPGKLPGRAA